MKSYIRDQIKLGRLATLTEQCEPIDYFRRIIEEINARNYTGLLAISHEYSLALGPLDRMLDRKASQYYSFDQMPKACEIQALRLILSPDAQKIGLLQLGGERELDDFSVRKLYFWIFGARLEQEEMALVEELGLKRVFQYIWEQGLRRYFNARYNAIKGIPSTELSIKEAIEELTLPVILDEDEVIRRFAGMPLGTEAEKQDLRDQLAQENAKRSEALARIESIYREFAGEEINFKRLKKTMLEARMEVEVANIEQEGLSSLRDYIRRQGVTGAREVALRYDFVCPAVLESDPAQARHAIASSFFTQAGKSVKGKYFLRAEVLSNLKTVVRKGQSWKLPGGYVLSQLQIMDGEDHYLFARNPSRAEQYTFNLVTLSNFIFHEVPVNAASNVVRYFIRALAGGIRTSNAVRKMLLALPIVLGLAALVGVLYYMIFEDPVQSILVGGGITFIGMAIAGKNGYDEPVTPVGHEKIPSYLARKGGKTTATNAALLLHAEEEGRKAEAEE